MKSRPGHQYAELSLWLLLAVVAFGLSFEFDQPSDIYKLGAAAWPRAVITLIILAALAQFWQQGRARRTTDKQQAVSSTTELPDGDQLRFTPRFLFILGILLAYASLLDQSGFYFNAPVLLVAYLLLIGERSWKRILGVTTAIYIPIVVIFTKLFYLGLPLGYAFPFYDLSSWIVSVLR